MKGCKKSQKFVVCFIIIFMSLILYLSIFSAAIYSINYIKTSEDFFINVTQRGLTLKSLNLLSKNDDTVTVEVTLPDLWIAKDRWIAVTASSSVPSIYSNVWQKVNGNKKELLLDENSNYIYIRDEGEISEVFNVSDYVNTIISLKCDVSDDILYIGDSINLEYSILKVGNPDDTIKINADREGIVEINGNKITGIRNGKTKITISDSYSHKKEFELLVTDLITKPTINDNKSFLKVNQYTEDEAKLLDELLAFEINKAGEGTRAGAVAAARFLSLQFKYKVPYFLENGRLQKHGTSDWVDGEGRYYHKGLYLSTSKYSEITSSIAGPAMWGKYITEYSNERIMPNGLDCSGFISWCLYNGGFDPGDIGAGPNYGYKVLTDLGKSQRINMSLLKSGKVKVGDLIGWEGHIGIIIGIEDGYITVADTILYERGVCATRYSYNSLIYSSGFTHVYDMKNYYKKDGKLENMW